MAAPTFSLSLTGYGAHNPNITYQSVKVPDTTLAGNALNTTGGVAGAMSRGSLLICKGPDGQLRLHKIDAERSTPSNLVLLRV
jgi:hypothetical protein